MKERDFVYDIETYRNLFLFVVVHVETRTRWIFEVSDRMNQSHEFFQFVQWLQDIKARLIGYNNEGFDWIVCQHLVLTFPQGFTAFDAYLKTQEIFNTQDRDRFGMMIWPDQRLVTQIDLFKIHHFDNVSKSTSLKKLEIAMQSRNVEDLPFDPHTNLTFDQMDVVLHYGCHDVSETLKFTHHSREQIEFRDTLLEQYPDLGDVLNFNDTKIGKKFFERELEKVSPGICYTRNEQRRRVPRQTRRPVLPLKDAILDKVYFQSEGFQNVLERMKSSQIVQTKGAFDDLVAMFDGIEFSFGTGGIHASRHNESVYPNDEYALIDVDVSSYYPNMAIANGFYPEHLSSLFCEIYLRLYLMRKEYPKASSINAMLKLALNGVYGDSGNEYSPFFDLMYLLRITLNGQLFLCMLCEWVVFECGCKMVQANTDGITCLVPRNRLDLFKEICGRWENHTGLELEHVDYSAMHIRDVNNYMAVKTKDGSVKRIGDYAHETARENPYTREIQWHKDHSALVVPKAAEAFLVRGVPVEDFIKSHRDPFDFMLSVKVPKSSRLEMRWADGRVEPVQNTTRYYVARGGCTLTKVMPPLAKKPGVERPIGIEKGWKVKVVNNADLFDWNDVNWLYYIERAKKLVDWRL